MDINIFRKSLASKQGLLKEAQILSEAAITTFNYGGGGTENSKGMRSPEQKTIRINDIMFKGYKPASQSEIWVYFSKADWNTEKGLLCGDKQFLKDLQEYLKSKGFPYTEDIKWKACTQQGRNWALFSSGARLYKWYTDESKYSNGQRIK